MTEPSVSAPAAALRPSAALPDWARIAGGVLFAIGALMLFLRKSNAFADEADWGDFPLLLVLLVPCALLFAAALADRDAVAAPRAWQSVYLVLGLIFVPLALFQFLDLIGGDVDNSLNAAWIFALTGAIALVTSLRLGALYQALLGGLALIVAWIALWDKILDDPSTTTLRWLFVVIAALLIGLAVVLRAAGRPQAHELVTAGGVAGVFAGALGSFQLATELAGAFLDGGGDVEGASTWWDIFLLIASVALIVYAVHWRVRGPAYVGGLGLFAFTIVVGAELASLAAGEDAEREIVGWPLLLIALGVAGFVAGMLLSQDDGDRVGPGRATGAPTAGEEDGGLLDQWRGQPPASGHGPPPGGGGQPLG